MADHVHESFGATPHATNGAPHGPADNAPSCGADDAPHGRADHRADHGADDRTDNADSATGHAALSEEALRLVSSVQDWARRSFPQQPDGHGASQCQWCPLCQFVGVLRGERPEVTARVAEAGNAVVAALRAVLDAAADAGVPGGHHRHCDETARRPRVQRINLVDEP